MTQAIDSETKTLLQEIKASLEEQSKVKAAVNQLEEQMKGIPGTIENKLTAIRSMTFDGTSRYRGLFDSPDQARSFGLLSVAKVAQKSWAIDALKSEFPDIHKDFTSTDADALIPEDTAAVLVDLIEQNGVFERNALSYPMPSDRTAYPKKTGRTAAVPMGEGTSVAETKPTIVKKFLIARKWGVYTEIPTEVEDDMIGSLAELIAADMAEAHATAVDQAGFLGDGTATYNQIIAAATGVGLETRSSATALSSVNFAIRGQGTPGGQDTLERLNIDRSNVLVALEQLVDARERGDLSLADIESLGGREAAALFASLSDRETFDDFVGKVRSVDAAEDFQGSLAQDAASSIFTPGSIQSSNLLAKQFEVEEEGIRAGDERAARVESFRTGLSTLLAAELAKEGGGDFEITPALAEKIKEKFEHFIGLGRDPLEALRRAEEANTVGTITLERRGQQRDGADRAGLFSDPLSVLIPQGIEDEPELLSARAQHINDIVQRDIVAEFGRDIRLDGGLSRIQNARIEEIRERATRPSLDHLPADVQRSQEEINRRDEELLNEAFPGRQRSAVPDPDLDPFGSISDERSAVQVIQHQTVINGTQINNATDPATGDRELVRRRVV